MNASEEVVRQFMSSVYVENAILVTGTAGMVGSAVAKELADKGYRVIGLDWKEKAGAVPERYRHIVVDLSDSTAVEEVLNSNRITHVIHLAALAHTAGETDLSWEKYYQINVVNSCNVFRLASKRGIPILFSSTADVYGIVDGIADADTVLHPIGPYGKSKAQAEEDLRKICQDNGSPYAIFRFAPVYTKTVKRDIQKRYYLKYPAVAYLVGGGAEYEVLDINTAVEVVVDWIEKPHTGIWNVKDKKLMSTTECIKLERAKGRANIIIRLPRWLVLTGYWMIKLLLGKDSPKVFLLNKVTHPLRTE